LAHGFFEELIGLIARGGLAGGVKGREVSFQASDDLRPSFRGNESRS
jgi:hypothetical protein